MIYTALLPLAPAALPMSASPQPGRPTWGSASLCPVMTGPQRSPGRPHPAGEASAAVFGEQRHTPVLQHSMLNLVSFYFFKHT